MKIICQEVAREFNVTEAQLVGNQRWYPLALARQIAMVLCLESHPFACAYTVSRYFKRHRSMCSHAVKKVNHACDTNPQVEEVVRKLRKKLGLGA